MIEHSPFKTKMILSLSRGPNIDFIIDDMRYGRPVTSETIFCIRFSILTVDEKEESVCVYKIDFKGNDRDKCLADAFEDFLLQWSEFNL